MMMDKAADAFRTISEVADELGIQQHVLRFWETKFAQIKPLKRGGGRRYYRPDDVDLLRGIRYLLYGQGYTIKGVQRIIKEHGSKAVIAAWIELSAETQHGAGPVVPLDVGLTDQAGQHELDATSDVSEQLFASVRSFAEEDEAEQGMGTAPSSEAALAPVRPEFQQRPDVSIMRGGLSGAKAGRPNALPPKSSSAKSASPERNGEGATLGDQHGPDQQGPGAATLLSSADRAMLNGLMQELAECRRVLDAAGRS